jgi:hypothetical protein
MTAICTDIEIELRSILGDTDLPERVRPVDAILM